MNCPLCGAGIVIVSIDLAWNSYPCRSCENYSRSCFGEETDTETANISFNERDYLIIFKSSSVTVYEIDISYMHNHIVTISGPIPIPKYEALVQRVKTWITFS